jgi:hypothetical protein
VNRIAGNLANQYGVAVKTVIATQEVADEPV